LRNNGRQCLEVQSRSDTHNRKTVWVKCNNYSSERWYLDPKGIHVPQYPLKDATRFQIKSRMKTNRALYAAEHIGGSQFRLRIRDNNPADK